MRDSGAGSPVDREAIAEFTLRLVGEESLSGNEGAVARLVEAEMNELGFNVEIDDLGNVIGTIDAGPGPCVLIDSHMDTVGVTDPDAWSHSPGGERVDDLLYGRGTMDMKGPLAASVYGIASLASSLERGKVVVSATIAEELVEGPATLHVAKRVEPSFVIICEATSLALARGQRGRAEVMVEVFGRPTHSSRPELGVNAAQGMVDVIMALRDFTPPRHEVLGRGILVLTDVISDPYPGLSVVPDRCTATFDRRTLPGETEKDVLSAVEEALEQALKDAEATGRSTIADDDFLSYTGTRVTAPNFAPAWYYEEEEEIVATALKALEEVGITPQLSTYAFCTNGSGTAGRLGVPTVGFGPGEEELAHRVDEHIAAEQLGVAAEGYASIARHLTSLGGG